MRFIILVLSAMCISLFPLDSKALDLKISVAELPPSSAYDSNGNPAGPLVEIINAIDEIYQDGDITITLVPFARSLKHLASGRADVHIPIIRSSSVPLESVPYVYSTANWGKVAFVLYTHKDKPRIDKGQLNQYQIEVMRGQSVFYDFPTIEGNSSKQALLKLAHGRIDGYIGEQEISDAVIIKHRLKQIRRQLFVYFDACFLIAKGENQRQIDLVLSHAVEKLEAQGKLEEMAGRIHSSYKDWQPFEYNW